MRGRCSAAIPSPESCTVITTHGCWMCALTYGDGAAAWGLAKSVVEQVAEDVSHAVGNVGQSHCRLGDVGGKLSYDAADFAGDPDAAEDAHEQAYRKRTGRSPMPVRSRWATAESAARDRSPAGVGSCSSAMTVNRGSPPTPRPPTKTCTSSMTASSRARSKMRRPRTTRPSRRAAGCASARGLSTSLACRWRLVDTPLDRSGYARSPVLPRHQRRRRSPARRLARQPQRSRLQRPVPPR